MATIKKKKQSNSVKTRRIWALILTALLFAGSLFIAFPPQDKINQGLDIQGGLSVVLAANPEEGQEVTPEDMEKAKSIIETRVNALGASEASVQIQGDNQILVQIPGLSDSSQALATIGKTGVLEFARLDSFTDETVKNNIESGNIIDYTSVDMPEGDAPTGTLPGLMDYSDAKHITVDSGTYTPLFTGEHITNVSVGRESDTSQYYAVNIRLDPEATEAFATASTELLPTNGKVVILLDNEVNSAPAIQAAITTGEVSITGNYTLEEARALQTVLDSGSLPVSFTYEQSQTVGPTLGQGELSAGIMSMIIGIVLVMIYLILFYKGFGLVPAANMIVFFVLYMGVLGTLSAMGLFSLSLAGIAGIILSIGMTADSVILSIEKFKEELKEGRTVKSASEKGVKHAIITSIDADVVSLISALALFFLATSSIKGFGLTLALGILCDILVMLLFVSPLIRLLATKCMKYHPKFWGIAYAQELGDVRTGSQNYMLPEQVAEKKEDDKEKKIARKQSEKKAKSAQKERDKASNERIKEMKKERKAAEKQAKRDEKVQKKEKLAALKEADAACDAARKEAKKAEKEAARAAKKAEKATDEMEAAEDKIKDLEEDGTLTLSEGAEEMFDALDKKAKADDNFETFVEKVKEAKDREKAIEEQQPAVSDETDKENADTASDEIIDERTGIEARSSSEVSEILTNISGTDIAEKVLEREEVQDDTIETGPDDSEEYGVADELEILNPSDHKNRAARRAEAKAKKNEKN